MGSVWLYKGGGGRLRCVWVSGWERGVRLGVLGEGGERVRRGVEVECFGVWVWESLVVGFGGEGTSGCGVGGGGTLRCGVWGGRVRLSVGLGPWVRSGVGLGLVLGYTPSGIVSSLLSFLMSGLFTVEDRYCWQ